MWVHITGNKNADMFYNTWNMHTSTETIKHRNKREAHLLQRLSIGVRGRRWIPSFLSYLVMKWTEKIGRGE